jgi:hypothetical protein
MLESENGLSETPDTIGVEEDLALLQLQGRHPIAFADAQRMANSSGQPVTVVPTKVGADLYYGAHTIKGGVIVKPSAAA